MEEGACRTRDLTSAEGGTVDERKLSPQPVKETPGQAGEFLLLWDLGLPGTGDYPLYDCEVQRLKRTI